MPRHLTCQQNLVQVGGSSIKDVENVFPAWIESSDETDFQSLIFDYYFQYVSRFDKKSLCSTSWWPFGDFTCPNDTGMFQDEYPACHRFQKLHNKISKEMIKTVSLFKIIKLL